MYRVAMPSHKISWLHPRHRDHGSLELQVRVRLVVVLLTGTGDRTGDGGVERQPRRLQIEEWPQQWICRGVLKQGTDLECAFLGPGIRHTQSALIAAEHGACTGAVIGFHLGIDSVLGVKGVIFLPATFEDF